MAGLARGEERVVEVQVAHQRAVVERRPIGRALALADQRRQRRAAELPHLRCDHSHRLAVERPQRAPQRVQHPQLELVARRLRDVLEPRTADELRQLIDLRVVGNGAGVPPATAGRVTWGCVQRARHHAALLTRLSSPTCVELER